MDTGGDERRGDAEPDGRVQYCCQLYIERDEPDQPHQNDRALSSVVLVFLLMPRLL